MSRAEKHRELKAAEKKKKVYNLTQEQIAARVRVLVDVQVQEQTERIINETIENTLAATIHVLNESFGLGAQRIKRFVGEYNATFDNVLAGSLDLSALREGAARFGISIQGEEDTR